MPATKKTEAVEGVEVEGVAVDLEGAYAPFAAPVLEALGQWETAEDAVTTSRVNLGRIIGKAIGAMTTAGASGDEARDRVMIDVSEFTAAVEWETISGWVRAAAVADTLDPEVAEKFSTEALKAIGSMPENVKEGTEGVTRKEFAATLADEGVLSVRAIRDAVKAEKGTTGTTGTTKGNAAQAADAVKVIRKLITTGEGFEGAVMLPVELIEALVMLGVDTRTKCPKFRPAALRAAVQEVFHREDAPAS